MSLWANMVDIVHQPRNCPRKLPGMRLPTLGVSETYLEHTLISDSVEEIRKSDKSLRRIVEDCAREIQYTSTPCDNDSTFLL